MINHASLKRLFAGLRLGYPSFDTIAAVESAIDDRLATGRPVLCNLGCGTRHHPAWINIDFQGNGHPVLSWDLRRGLPLPDTSCDGLYSSHTIEHFDRAGTRRFLTECHRALKPGGILRLVAPDLEGIARTYLQCLDAAECGKDGAAARYEWIVIELLDQLVRHESGGEMLKLWCRSEVPAEDFIVQRVGTEYWRARQHCKGRSVSTTASTDATAVGRFRLGGEVHQWMYDRYSLGQLVMNSGFVQVRTCGAAESSIKGFVEYGLDTERNGTTYKPDSFFLEARKP